MTGWPALHLLLQLGLVWVALRIIAGRTTLSIRQLGVFAAIGASFGTFSLTIGQHVVFERIDTPSAFWAWAPVQELTVVIVLALVAASRLRRAYLSVVDYALVGGAVATGTTTIQLIMQAVVHGGPASWYQPSFFAPLPGSLYIEEIDLWFAGPIMYGLLIGLGVGVGARVWPRRNVWALTGGAAALYAMADHAEAVYRLSGNLPIAQVLDVANFFPDFSGDSGLTEFVRAITFQGRAVLVLVYIGLLVAGPLEGILVGRRLGDTRALMLTDEPQRPVTVIEWLAGWSRLRFGIQACRDTFAYFRDRRALLLRVATRVYGPDDDAASLLAELQGRRAQLAEPTRHRTQLDPTRAGGIVLREWPVVLALGVTVLVLVYDADGPDNGERRWWQTESFGDLLLLITLVTGVVQIVRWARAGRFRRPAVHGIDPPVRSWLFASGVFCLVSLLWVWENVTVARDNSAADLSAIVPYYAGAGLRQTTLVEWVLWGGNPVGLLAVVTLLGFAWVVPRRVLAPDSPPVTVVERHADVERDASGDVTVPTEHGVVV